MSYNYYLLKKISEGLYYVMLFFCLFKPVPNNKIAELALLVLSELEGGALALESSHPYCVVKPFLKGE